MASSNASHQLSPAHTETVGADKKHDEMYCKHLLDSDTEPDRTPGSDVSPQQVASQNPQQYHHRRKRIRISPLARVSGDSHAPIDAHGANQPGRYQATVNLDADGNSEATPSMSKSDPVPGADSNAIGSQTLGMDPSEPVSVTDLTVCKIDPELQAIVLKYVRLNSVVRCLELAGYCSPFVLACLDEPQIQRLEDFIGHTCSLIDSLAVREQFLGPIFAKYPEQFRLPAGTVCGLLLAAADIKRRYRRVQNTHLMTTSSIPLDFHSTEEFLTEQGFADAASQTDASVPLRDSKSPQVLSESDPSTVTPVTSASTVIPCSVASVSHSVTTCASEVSGAEDIAQTTKLAPLITSIDQSATPNTVAMMAAAFQAAAVAASGSNYPKPSNLFTSSPSNSMGNHFVPNSPLSHSSTGMVNALNGAAFPTDPSTVITTVQNAARLVAAVSGCTIQNSLQSLTSVVGSGNGTNSLGVMHDEEVIDLERLKQHSSASAIRLASRQFVNAHLVRGRDFDMEMEISVTPEGLKRVTGIFYCHLCREKRERTSAVRFSIARNRYPVLSNVLSHLKTHFQYRGQLFHMQPNTQLFPQIKSPYCSGEPFLNLSPSAAATATGGLSGSSPSTASVNPLSTIGLSLNPSSYADLSTPSAELSALGGGGGGGSFLNPGTGVSQPSLMIKGEALDSRTDPRLADETGANSSGSDTRTSLNSEHCSSPPRTGSTLLEPSESNATCGGLMRAENGLSLDLFTSQTSSANAILPR